MGVSELIPVNVLTRSNWLQCLIMAVSATLILLAKSTPVEACSPTSYFLFRAEAQARLDSLRTRPAAENALERFILMHNLAFHKDKNRREQAEKLLEKQPHKKSRPALVLVHDLEGRYMS